MFDIPLKAWNNKGISQLASSIGKPLIMDVMTANMCQYGRERLGYARVLVEVDARKQFKDGIDVQYGDINSWKRMIDKELTHDDNEDVIEELNGRCMMENEIEGMEECNSSFHQ
ncbi:RNA-directed DNA polymerase, eukaryota, reverse transcriptase zinc-binding domain protein [Tanacetum coccineum]